jgi:hypothetical protein
VLDKESGITSDDWNNLSSVRAPYPDEIAPPLIMLDMLLHPAFLYVSRRPTHKDLHIMQLVVHLLREGGQ